MSAAEPRVNGMSAAMPGSEELPSSVGTPRPVKLGRTEAIALSGLDGTHVIVESSVNPGIPGIDVVGLPDASVSESRKRIRAALSNLGVRLKAMRYTVSLSPGSVRKIGSGFDLAIATAVLGAEGIVDADRTTGVVFCGELGLDGRIVPVPGVLPTIVSGLRAGFTHFVVPAGSAEEANLVPGAKILPVASVAECAAWFGADMVPGPVEIVRDRSVTHGQRPDVHDLAQVQGQDDARYALEVAAAGGHHLIMTGSPGAGKTLLAGCLPGILPPLDENAAVEVLALASLAGTFSARDVPPLPPFETPHHRTTAAAMLGSSRPNSVGVFSRAHHGVLFMDEARDGKCTS